MIPVDLNRLREARGSSVWIGGSENTADDAVINAAVGAVLDAPTVWWCANKMEGFSVMHACCASDHGCGFMALVPVRRGSPDATVS